MLLVASGLHFPDLIRVSVLDSSRLIFLLKSVCLFNLSTPISD